MPRSLRFCPLCGSDAVAAAEHSPVDALHLVIEQQCGQCRAWRRTVTTPWVIAKQERLLTRDRDAIRRRVQNGEAPLPAPRRHTI